MNDWHQPLDPNNTEFVMYHRTVKSPKLDTYYDGVKIVQKKSFKYLIFRLDAELPFCNRINAQFITIISEMKH